MPSILTRLIPLALLACALAASCVQESGVPRSRVGGDPQPVMNQPLSDRLPTAQPQDPKRGVVVPRIETATFALG